MGKTVILCDHDLTDYEAYIQPYGGAKRRATKEINQIPSSEMTQVSSKGSCF